MNDYRPAGQQIDPLPVRITASDVPLAKTGKRRRRGFAARSFILNANDPAQEILPQSDARTEAYITSMTNACFVGTSKADVLAAASASGGNGAANIPANSIPVPLCTTDQVWASSGTLPTTIGVIAFYEQPE